MRLSNYVIARKTDMYFKEGKQYPIMALISNQFAVSVLDEYGNPCTLGLRDTDFTFVFNDRASNTHKTK